MCDKVPTLEFDMLVDFFFMVRGRGEAEGRKAEGGRGSVDKGDGRGNISAEGIPLSAPSCHMPASHSYFLPSTLHPLPFPTHSVCVLSCAATLPLLRALAPAPHPLSSVCHDAENVASLRLNVGCTNSGLNRRNAFKGVQAPLNYVEHLVSIVIKYRQKPFVTTSL